MEFRRVFFRSLLAAGRGDDPAQAFAAAAILLPDLVGSSPDERLNDEVRKALASQRSSGRDPGEAIWNAALLADELHPDARPPWEVARRVDDGDPRAEAALAAATRLAPHDPYTMQSAAAVARMNCDRSAYERAKSRLRLIDRDTPAFVHGFVTRRAGLYAEPEL